MEAIDESFQGVNIKFFNRLYVGLLDWIGSPRSRKWTGSKSSRNAHTFKDLVGNSREQIEDTIEAECAILQDKLRKNHSSPWRFIREICGMRKTVFNYGAGQSNRKRLAAVKDFFSKIANRGVGDTKVEFQKKKNPNHSGLLRMVTGKPDPSQTDLEVPRPTSSTSFRLSKAATTCSCQHAASTNCTSTRLTQEV